MVTMYQRLMITPFPKQWIVWSFSRYDVIYVTIVQGAGQATPTGTDTWHTEVDCSILAPLMTIASLGCAGSWLYTLLL